MRKISSYLKEQFKPFDRNSLWSPDIIKQASAEIFWWMFSTIIFVLIVAKYQQYLPSKYLAQAITEGIGPHLWNVIGVLALTLVGVALLLPKLKFIAKAAYHLLINTHAIGAMSFGLLFGQFFAHLSVWSENLALWKSWFLGLGGIFLLIYALTLNFSLWYLGHLMYSQGRDNSFLNLIAKVHLRVRFIFFLLFSALPIALLLAEK